MDVVKLMDSYGSPDGTPTARLRISNCGQLITPNRVIFGPRFLTGDGDRPEGKDEGKENPTTTDTAQTDAPNDAPTDANQENDEHKDNTGGDHTGDDAQHDGMNDPQEPMEESKSDDVNMEGEGNMDDRGRDETPQEEGERYYRGERSRDGY